MRIIAAVQDSHDNLWSSLNVRPPLGECQLPVMLRYIEKRFVISDYASDTLGYSSGLQIGDAITAIDSLPVKKLLSQVSPYYGDSNNAARFRDIGRYLSRGACGRVPIEVRRDNTTIKLDSDRVAISKLDLARDSRHDLPGDTLQVLPQNIAYLKQRPSKVAPDPTAVPDSSKRLRVSQQPRAFAWRKDLLRQTAKYPLTGFLNESESHSGYADHQRQEQYQQQVRKEGSSPHRHLGRD
jgi:hypothetical protein